MGFAQEAKREEVRQGFQSMSPRLEAMETALLQKRLRVGNQPVLNMGAAASKVKLDPAANKKITKETYHGPKVDGIVALVMAAYPLIVDTEPSFSVDALIG
jgi:phage terminase large subunit-like protein